MPNTNVIIRTSQCDQCKKSATFEVTQQGGVDKAVLEEYPWLKSGRLVQTIDGRVLYYCSDECEVLAIGTGVHNQKEPELVDKTPPNKAAIAAALRNAKASAEATKAIKTGAPAIVSG